MSLDPPSRLKGIETIYVWFKFVSCKFSLDPPSRLKGIETYLKLIEFYFLDLVPYPLDPPSRLKGIETNNRLPYVFSIILWIRLPV